MLIIYFSRFGVSLMLIFFFLSNHVIKGEESRGDIRIMFYNVENLFDVYDDPGKKDEDFLPSSPRRWNTYKYQEKQHRIFQVIAGVGGWSPPEIIGLCEIENKKVLYDLIKQTPLLKFEYDIVHYDSPDFRGIDVALLYQKQHFTLLKTKKIQIETENNFLITRDVLYVKGKTVLEDTLHLLVNHWPSRRGGKERSEKNRLLVASVVRNFLDSVFLVENNPRFILMGDFNDNPGDKSIHTILKANPVSNDILAEGLYNVSRVEGYKRIRGTLKYKNEWSIFDQFIVSGVILDENNNIHMKIKRYMVYDPEFLLEKDKKYLGVKPYRTYLGMGYNNGFSDHLPVYIDLFYRKSD